MTAYVAAIDRLDLTLDGTIWPFAQTRRAEIDAYFEKARQQKAELWNGRVLLLHRYEIDRSVLRGVFLETDFASFFCWREWGQPAAGIHDCFAAAAVESADGAFMIGVMAPHTANAGQVYFPCGTPDRSDVTGGCVDFDRSVARELDEETGLRIEALSVEPGWTLVQTVAHMALIKRARSTETADALHARVVAHLAKSQKPELSGIRFVRTTADFTPEMFAFVPAFLSHLWH